MNYNKYKLVTFLKINNPAFIYVFNVQQKKSTYHEGVSLSDSFVSIGY